MFSTRCFFGYTKDFLKPEIIHLVDVVAINTQRNDLIFQRETDQELWKYIIGFFSCVSVYFGKNKNESTRFCIEIDLRCNYFRQFDSTPSSILIIDEFSNVYWKLCGVRKNL